MLAVHELFKNLKEEQSQIESIEADVRLKTDSVRSLAQKLEELENVVASYDKDLLNARGEYTNVMEKNNHFLGLLAEEKKKQYSLHLQLNAAEDERRTVNEALLQMASKHATNLHRLALVKIHTLKGFAPSVAEEVQPPKTVKIVAEEGDIPAAVKEVPAVAMTKSLDEEEDLHVAKKMRIIEHSEPAKGGAQDNIVSAPISV